jgi:hypothetical protein
MTAEDLYLDRLPWEVVHASDPRPKMVQVMSAERLLLTFVRGSEPQELPHERHLPYNWAEFEWPLLRTHRVNETNLDTRQLSFWLRGRAEGIGAMVWEQPAKVEDTIYVLEVFDRAGQPDNASEAHSPSYLNENSDSTADDQPVNHSSSDTETAREPRSAWAHYRARLQLLPRFVSEVLKHPISDFTLLKRGNEVFVVEEGVDLSGKDLSGADLHRANLRKADLRGTNLTNATLRGADLKEADLRDAILDNSDLREADLRGSKADTETLSRAVTDGALISGDRLFK